MLTRFSLLSLLALIGCGGAIEATDADPIRDDGPSDARDKRPSKIPTSVGGSKSEPGVIVAPGAPAPGSPKRGCLLHSTGGSTSIDFESGAGVAGTFGVSSPGAFSIESKKPIAGAFSLRVKPDPSSYLTHEAAGLCYAAVGFSLRFDEEFREAGGTLVRIDAGSRSAVVGLAGGKLFVQQTVTTADAMGMGTGPQMAGLGLGVHRLVVRFDVTAPTLTVTINDNTTEVPVLSAERPLVAPAAITAIQLGSVPGFASVPRGTYWLDDLTFE